MSFWLKGDHGTILCDKRESTRVSARWGVTGVGQHVPRLRQVLVIRWRGKGRAPFRFLFAPRTLPPGRPNLTSSPKQWQFVSAKSGVWCAVLPALPEASLWGPLRDPRAPTSWHPLFRNRGPSHLDPSFELKGPCISEKGHVLRS